MKCFPSQMEKHCNLNLLRAVACRNTKWWISNTVIWSNKYWNFIHSFCHCESNQISLRLISILPSHICQDFLTCLFSTDILTKFLLQPHITQHPSLTTKLYLIQSKIYDALHYAVLSSILSLRFKYSPQYPVLKHFQDKRPHSCPYKEISKMICLYI